MSEKTTFQPETLESYQELINERVLDSSLIESQIYTFMMRVRSGRVDAMSSPVSVKKIMSIGEKTLTVFSFLSEDLRPVLDFGGCMQDGHWKADRVISFVDAAHGSVQQGYLTTYQDGIDTGPLQEVNEREFGIFAVPIDL
jgi:hypothetical protein